MKGILLIGYGTRSGNITDVLERQAARLRARGRRNVYVAYFRVSGPSIGDALRAMRADGVDDVLAVPYFIAEGRLTREIIPAKIAEASEGMRVQVAPAFGMTRALTAIACDRIADAGGSPSDGILILGHGSRGDNGSNEAVVRLNAERLGNRGYGNVAHAFNEFCGPSIGESLDVLAGRGADSIVCVPMFVAMGVHLGEEIPDQIGIPHYSDGGVIERGGRKINVKYTRPLEDDSRLLEIIDSQAGDFLAN